MAGDCGKCGRVFVIFWYPTPPTPVISLLKVVMSHFCTRCLISLFFYLFPLTLKIKTYKEANKQKGWAYLSHTSVQKD